MATIRSNFLYNVLFTVINFLFPLVSFQYTLHVLGPIGIGKTQFVLSLTQYFIIIAAVGMPVYGVRKIALCLNDKDKLSTLFSELLTIHIINSLVLGVIYLFTIYYFGYFQAEQKLYLAGSSIVLLGFSSIDWFYNGLSNFRQLTITSLVVKCISLLMLFIFVRSAQDYYHYLLISLGAILGGNLINIIVAKKTISFTLKGLDIKQHIGPLLLVFGVGVGSSIYTVLDTVLLGFLTYPKIVGLYTCAVKFCKLFIPFISMMGVVLLPEISKEIEKTDLGKARPLLDRSFEFIVFFSIPVSFGLYLLAPEIIQVFSGRQFIEALTAMRILSALPFLVGLGYFFSSQVLFSGGRYKDVFLSVLPGIVLSILLNVILVPRYLHNGAAIANVVSEFVVTGCYYYFIRRNYPISINFSSIFKTTGACLFFIPIAYFIRLTGMPALVFILVTTLACVIAFVAAQWLLFKNSIVNYLYIFAISKFKPGTTKLPG